MITSPAATAGAQGLTAQIQSTSGGGAYTPDRQGPTPQNQRHSAVAPARRADKLTAQIQPAARLRDLFGIGERTRPATAPRRSAHVAPGQVVVDVCDGSGALALAIAADRPDDTVHAVELDPRRARRNASARAGAGARRDGRRTRTRPDRARSTSGAALFMAGGAGALPGDGRSPCSVRRAAPGGGNVRETRRGVASVVFLHHGGGDSVSTSDQGTRTSRRVALGLLGIGPLIAGGALAAADSGGGTRVSRDLLPGGAYDRYIRELAEADQFSGTVLIAHRGRPVLARAYGMADRERGIRTGSTRSRRRPSRSRRWLSSSWRRRTGSGSPTPWDAPGRVPGTDGEPGHRSSPAHPHLRPAQPARR